MKQYDLTRLNALISVWYKKEHPDFDRMVKAIHGSGHLINSTGGTAEHIANLGIPVREVSDVTEFPEMMEGRVKTLHPKIFGGILGRTDNADDIRAMSEHQIPLIDIVVVNLYPFVEEVAKGNQTTHANIIEKIDVGGPSMIRAAAKNHARVIVICDPKRYGWLADKLENRKFITLEERELLAAEAFSITAEYERNIDEYFKRYTSKAKSSETTVA